MPDKPTRRTLSRQWELLKLLPSRGVGKTASELANELLDAGFKVSKRQVERDLWDLLEAFNLECNDKSPPYGWKWPTGASPDMPGLTLAEALSLRLVKNTIQPLLPLSILHVLESRFTLAEKKLSSLAEDATVARWPDLIRTVPPTQPLLPPSVDGVVLDTVQEALLAGRQVEVDYLGMDSASAQTMRLHPLGIIHRAPVTYLVATAWNYDDVRLFALHRMVSAKQLGETLQRPAEFNIDQYINSGAIHFGDGSLFCLEALISEGLARILTETPLSADQTLDSGRLKATVQDTWQLMWWILGQGEAIVVTGPAEFRDKVKVKLQKTLAGYESEADSGGSTT